MPVPATKGQLRTTVKDMEIGDYIACKVKNQYPINTASYPIIIGELGTPDRNEVTSGESKVYGGASITGEVFYFVKVATGLLIADRVVQTGIPWNTHHGFRMVEGMYMQCLVYSNLAQNNGELADILDKNSGKDWSLYSYTWETRDIYVQYDYLYPKTMTGIDISTRLFANGFEPMRDFVIEASNDCFVTKKELFSGTYSTYGTETKFTFANDTPYLSYRLVIKTWAINGNGGDGQTIKWAVPVLKESNNDLVLRAPSGGLGYLNDSGGITGTDQGLGTFPHNNEWDKYILGFDPLLIKDGHTLDDVFHCYYSPVEGGTGMCTITSDLQLGTSNPVLRAKGFYYVGSTGSYNYEGYRPVLHYKEEL